MTARPRAKLLVRRGRRSISGSAMRPWRRTKAAGAGQGDEQGDDGDGHGAGEDRRDAVEDADEGQRDERGGGRVQPRTGDLGLVADADEGGDPGRRDEHGEEGEEQVPVAEPEDRAGDDRAGGRAEGRHRRDDAHRGAEPLGRRDRQCEVHADRHDHAGAEGLHDAVPRACTMRGRARRRGSGRARRGPCRPAEQAQGAQEEPVRAHRAVEKAGDGHHDRGGGYAGGGDPADGARADARVVHHRGQDHVEEGLVEGGEEGRGGRPRRRSPRRRCGSCVRGHAGNSSFFVMGTHARERGRAGHGHRQGAGDGDACAGARSRGDARDGVLGTATRQWPRRRRRCAARDAARGRVHGVAGGALPGRRAGTPTRRPGRP